MSLILHIDTATETAQVSFAKNAVVLRSLYNESQKDHGAFLQPAIQQLMRETAMHLKDIDTIAVTAGPGSYTGLRVGMASAKGLCYALEKPLITLNTLEVLAASALQSLANKHPGPSVLFCPMIDARRMEVYTALYDRQLKNRLAPTALILHQSSFKKQLLKNRIIFFGSGAKKWEAVCKDPNAAFETVTILPEAMAKLADICFVQQNFATLAYSEPFYLKDFQDVTNK